MPFKLLSTSKKTYAFCHCKIQQYNKDFWDEQNYDVRHNLTEFKAARWFKPQIGPGYKIQKWFLYFYDRIIALYVTQIWYFTWINSKIPIWNCWLDDRCLTTFRKIMFTKTFTYKVISYNQHKITMTQNRSCHVCLVHGIVSFLLFDHKSILSVYCCVHPLLGLSKCIPWLFFSLFEFLHKFV